jgi:hypothetical protein
LIIILCRTIQYKKERERRKGNKERGREGRREGGTRGRKEGRKE